MIMPATVPAEVIVGDIEDETPEFESELTSVVFNPTWSVPHSIASEELLPKIQRDPAYLRRGNYMVIDSGGITVVAVDDGIRGKDYVVINDGALEITAGGDGIKSDNEEDEARGFISISAGTTMFATWVATLQRARSRSAIPGPATWRRRK